MDTNHERIARRIRLMVEALERREQPAVLATLNGGSLDVTGDAEDNRISVFRDGSDIVVTEQGLEIGRFSAAAIPNGIRMEGGAGNDVLKIDPHVFINATLNGGAGDDRISGGGGTNAITGGDGDDVLKGGLGLNSFDGGAGTNNVYRVGRNDPVALGNPNTQFIRESVIPPSTTSLGQPQETLLASEVDTLLQRASAASASNDAIIAILDRNGRILGVRVEAGVDPAIAGNNAALVFAIDGAVAKARTGAFFGNNAAPLTSRTIQNISESTMTQREVDSNPNITDPNSTDRGPGFVANVTAGGHFPHNTAFTPQVDLFQIEHTNRDGTFHVGPDGIKGTIDDIRLTQRFDLPAAFVPAGQSLFPPDSFGFESGMLPGAQGRGIATLPGGIPILKNGQVVGGIGVFFPGKTGYATEENSSLSNTFDPTKPDRTLEAEWIAFAALGGEPGPIGGVALPGSITPLTAIADILASLNLNSIYLVGINLEIFGPGIPEEGVKVLRQIGGVVGRGDPNGGVNMAVDADANNDGNANDPVIFRDGLRVPEGWLVTPHDGADITAAEVEDIINRGITQAMAVRAAIRLPLGNRTGMVFAVSDINGEIVGLYRMPDATIFSIDVAVAKARNVGYYADANTLQAIDQVPGIPAGTAFTNRSFRYLGEPRFPLGIDGTPPGPFSQLNDDLGIDPLTGLQVGPRAPASQFQSVVGFDSFNPGTNFRDPNNITRQNGIVFFPGSAPLYKNGRLIGGFGVSGDGVDQDDIVTDAGQRNFGVPLSVNRIDQLFVRGVRVPYQKNLRNPLG
jgi:uncharacterized protein GlcG (DUF336 family)